MLEGKSDKQSSQSEVWIHIAVIFKATGTPEVFCFSFSPLPLLFPLLFCFYYSISSALWFPLISMPPFEFIPALPLPIALSLLSLFQCWGDPFAYRKKRNLRWVKKLDNCAAQFFSSWTLGNMYEGWLCTRTKGLGWAHLKPLSIWFLQGEINANFICSLWQRGPDGSLDVPTWAGEELD